MEFPSRRERDLALTRLLRREEALTARQIVALGFSKGEISSLVHHGDLTRIHHGVYLDGRTRPGSWTLLKAALLCVHVHGRVAFLSHRTAAAARGYRPINTREVHVSIVAAHTPRIRGLILHRTLAPAPGEVSPVAGLPIATPLRILLDLAAAGAPERELRELITAAERRGALAEVDAFVQRHGRKRGLARLRPLLAHHLPTPAYNSNLEAEVWAWYASQPDLPPPDETNVRLGPFEFDGLWRRQRLILEIDSRDYHQAKQDMDHDRRKDIYVQKHNLRIVRITADRFHHDRGGIRMDLLHFLVQTT